MAGKTKTDAMNERAGDVNATAAMVSGASLRLAGSAAAEPGKSARTKLLLQLAELCDHAADHLEIAHKTLCAEPNGAELAMDHLDSALSCLKQLSVEGLAAREESADRAQTA